MRHFSLFPCNEASKMLGLPVRSWNFYHLSGFSAIPLNNPASDSRCEAVYRSQGAFEISALDSAHANIHGRFFNWLWASQGAERTTKDRWIQCWEANCIGWLKNSTARNGACSGQDDKIEPSRSSGGRHEHTLIIPFLHAFAFHRKNDNDSFSIEFED